MTLPPFPSQDLAKLVLGYLAEEQLMTAYDEFLQASPYLDALGNEYDRIFMTSLKNILAEYRAVKIHVETCKPFVLRKKLFQCHNLLDMVKFLIQHVDINRLQDSNQSKYEADKSCVGNKCEVCKSLKQDHCTCSKKQLSLSGSQSRNHDLGHSESSVETTSLTDLPGNHVTCRRKNVRVLGAEVSNFNESQDKSDQSTCQTTSINVQTALHSSDVLQNNNLKKVSDSLDLNDKEEFNHILKQVCHKNLSETSSNSGIHRDTQRISTEGYNKFATGVTGVENQNINIPDSSTADNINVQVPRPKENISSNVKIQSRTQYLLKVANVKQPHEILNISTHALPNLKPNTEETKIKILSDVKVDNPAHNENGGSLKMPQILKNATSTPLMQMKTIVINGTPVYKQLPIEDNSYIKQSFTKDEIMAMPTIILAPLSGPPPNVAVPTVLKSSTATSQPNLSNPSRDLGPLVIDVASNDNKTSNENPETVNQTDTKDSKAAKIVDGTSASAPKDNSVASTETNTPQVAPPVRKSCSTPRRTSHVRVLDFTTPRRILHETINKCPPSSTSSDVEVVLSRSPNINYPVAINKEQIDGTTDSSKENNIQIKTLTKRNNWDADLRALAVVNEKGIGAQTTPTPKAKSTKKKRTPKSQSTKKDGKVNKKSESEKSSTKNKSRSKTSKKVSKPVIEDTQLTIEKEEIAKRNEVAIKPTINIIAGTDRCVPEKPTTNIVTGCDRCVPETSSRQNKSNNESDTPEMERLSLQNEIGAKLNISDLLETPYKQVLYDIQMETPRFLGADLNDDPLSAVKILSIPTPKFLNAPTPSSYSSRPTDYSSGGSYYKPDDQDYMRIADDLECPVSVSKNSETDSIQEKNHKNNDSSHKKEKNREKPSRPVRECTKNVSYFNNKTKSNDDKSTESSSETDINNIFDSPTVKALKISKEIRRKSQNRSDRKVISNVKKTPVKKDASKSFMKIKPRRPTPVKKDVARKKRGTPDTSKVKQRKRSIKETGVTPQVVCAPTKSRRKSSTPRKLHCTKPFNSESSGHESPDLVQRPKENTSEFCGQTAQDSDTEHMPLRWSDDGSQDAKQKEINSSSVNDIEDINKIQDYIKTVTNKTNNTEGEGSLHIDLVKRGFDLETAKIIERELLDTSPHLKQEVKMTTNVVVTPIVEKVNENLNEPKTDNVTLDKTLESDCSNNLQIVQDDNEDEEEIELSVHECAEESANYFTYNHNDTKDEPIKEIAKLKDKFSMEVCLDDDLSIRLRATTFSLLFDQDPMDDLDYQDQLETEMAVRSISNIERLYTPIKNSIKDIFDSTLTSLDTPLKVNTPMRSEDVTVTEIVLEVEKVDEKDKTDTKKRKRTQCGNLSDDSNESKKAKPEAQYLLNSANIQNIDIESVLSKLHGP